MQNCPIAVWPSMRRLVCVNRVLLLKADEGFRSSLSVFCSFCSLHTRIKVFTLIPWSRSLCSVLSPAADLLRWCGAGLCLTPDFHPHSSWPLGPVLVGVRLLVSRCCHLIGGLLRFQASPHAAVTGTRSCSPHLAEKLRYAGWLSLFLSSFVMNLR